MRSAVVTECVVKDTSVWSSRLLDVFGSRFVEDMVLVLVRRGNEIITCLVGVECFIDLV